MRSVPFLVPLPDQVMPRVGSRSAARSITFSQFGLRGEQLAVRAAHRRGRVVDGVVAFTAVDALDRARRVGVQVDDVVAGAGVDPVRAGVGGDGVVAVAAVDVVAAAAAVERVVAVAAVEDVGSLVALEVVVARAAEQRVVAEPAEALVVAVLADQAIVTRSAVHIVVARTSEDLVGAGVAGEHVVAGESAERVAAAEAVDHVRAGGARQSLSSAGADDVLCVRRRGEDERSSEGQGQQTAEFGHGYSFARSVQAVNGDRGANSVGAAILPEHESVVEPINRYALSSPARSCVKRARTSSGVRPSESSTTSFA